MEYKELSKLYHMDSTSDRKARMLAEEATRRNAESTFHTNIETPAGELFIAVPRELSILSEKILRTERRVSSIIRSMSDISADAVMRSFVLDEVVCTNAIEDIHSTRRQVKDALAATNSPSNARRFKELATLYLSILSGEVEIPQEPADIRTIYDKVMDGELDDNQVPDGSMFRKEGVDITSGGIRVIHRGLEPEPRIVEAMADMLRIVKSDEMPALFSAITSHYLFEYAHPFYDGNGRTGRYLLSLFLSGTLSIPTVLSLSHMILENRDSYYRAFRTAEDPLNRGELTFFVYSLLELIRYAQVGIIDRLEKSKTAYDALYETMSAIAKTYDLKPQETQSIFMLMQYETFGLMGDASVEEISSFLKIGKQMTRLHLGSLEAKGIIEKRKKRNPLTFALTSDFKRAFEVEAPEWTMLSI